MGTGEILFSDDFESGTVDMPPADWDWVLGYDPGAMNPNESMRAVVETSKAKSGTKSVHVVGGGNGPALLMKPLPQGTIACTYAPTSG